MQFHLRASKCFGIVDISHAHSDHFIMKVVFHNDALPITSHLYLSNTFQANVQPKVLNIAI